MHYRVIICEYSIRKRVYYCIPITVKCYIIDTHPIFSATSDHWSFFKEQISHNIPNEINISELKCTKSVEYIMQQPKILVWGLIFVSPFFTQTRFFAYVGFRCNRILVFLASYFHTIIFFTHMLILFCGSYFCWTITHIKWQ